VLIRVISWIGLGGEAKYTIHEITRINTNKILHDISHSCQFV